ncbi:hypothetical protein NE848_17235 [Gramella jeungdoensis]|uniref:DUF4382 domain-containing protein n=1 Tax=Gramella jeungdoensis TaxID=708091 RepID=A0ABT0Z5Y6_9FLAO|nr:hypothetical protein [Gramella jeungdoensis]MCM8571143.1 hypothetical protein [Gramella jeungdoensis]
MKLVKIISILIIFISCSKDDGIDLNETGENSFSVKINGKKFIPEDVKLFLNIDYGIKAYTNNNTWHLTFSDSEQKDIHFYIKDVTAGGKYQIGKLKGDLNFYTPEDDETAVGIADGSGTVRGVAYGSESGQQQFIEIIEVKGDSILIGQFDQIILQNPNNQNDKVSLTEGKFNINRSTLNN